MSVVTEKTWTITPMGVGRKDYSQNVEYAVESLIRSYQEEYHAVLAIENVPPGGGSVTVDIPIPGDTVVLLYNFNTAVWRNILIGLDIDAVHDGVVARVITERKYQRIKATIDRGFPFFQILRVTVTNYGTEMIDFDFHCNGVYTSEEEYYLEIG